jgi:hypothetical protein
VNEGNKIGTLILGISGKYLLNLYKNIDMGKGSGIFIIDSTCKVISSRTASIPLGGAFNDPSLI